MSLPPPGLGGGAARPGPPPGFGTSNGGNPPNNAGGIGGGTRNNNGAASIVKAQIVFLLTTLTDETFDKASKELRDLASSNGVEMYYHLIHRICMVANPHIQGLIQHFQQYKEDPAAPPPNLPTHGSPAVAWRLLISEAARAARDVTLAPQFSLAVLSPMNSTVLPLPSLRLFGLPPQFNFTLAAHTLASPNIFPPTQQFYNHVQSLVYQSYDATIDILVAEGPFWTYQTSPHHPVFSEDISKQEGQALILSLYPRAPPLGGPNSRPPSPAKSASPHPALLDTYRRTQFLRAITVKFTKSIIAESLSSLSPGGPPRSPGSIPLDHILFEIGELTNEDMAIEEVVKRWWSPWLLGAGDSRAITLELCRTIWGLCEGLASKRQIDIVVVIQVLVSLPGVSWPDVVRYFDQPSSPLAKEAAFPLVYHLLLSAPQHPVPPIAGLLPATLDAPIWDNTTSLLTILGKLISLPPNQFPIFDPNQSNPPSEPSAFARIVDPPTAQLPGPDMAKDEAAELQGAGIYNALGVIVVVVAAMDQADQDHASEDVIDAGRMASAIMEHSLSMAPELLLLGLERVKKPLSGTAEGYCDRLWAKYLGGLEPPACTSSTLVFHDLWARNPQRFWDRLIEFYNQDDSNIGRVVEIGMELDILDKLLSDENVHLTLDIASLGVEREYIDLEQWLADGVEVKGDDFLQSIFDFVEHKIRIEFDRRLQPGDDKSSPSTSLGPAVYSIFIRVIRNAENLTAEDVSRFKHMRTDILILHPSLLNFYPGRKEEQGFSEKKPAKEITSQVDQLYQDMYAGTTGLDEFIEDLKRRQKSDDPTDREIFAWCLHSIFDEYKFAKNYPPRELTMTGILFGAIIDSRLVKDIPAFVATRYVLDACRTNPSEPMHSFGINALSVLRRSLVDFPGLCRSLMEIPSLHEQHPVLINDIVAALTERAELDQQGGVKAAFPALKLPVLVEEGFDEFVEPEPKTKDAIMFIINQIAPSNYEQKSRDLLKLFEDQYSRWFAHYFIDVRVSLEQNRHDLYMNIIELLNSQVLEKHILWETYRKTRDLINAETTMSSASERTTLKTIALWLGRLTLARNKPIRMRELSVKDLLIQGFDNKRLIVAIPYVCNLLVSCKDSIIFHLPNPWLVAVLGLLVELYHYAELRLNLKFEIEVLFSKLDIAMDLVSPSNILRDHKPPAAPQEDVANRLQLEYERALAELSGGQRFETQDARLARAQAAETEAAAQEAQEAFYGTVNDLIARLPEKMVFSNEYPAFQAPSAKRPVHEAIARAIQDIIQPVVERSVTIAGISTRDLMAKDFATESDSAKLRHASHIAVKNLAGNLALVTCKDPLRNAMLGNIRQVLIENNIPNEMVPDQTIAGFVNDNLDVACSVVKEAAQDKALKDIDVNLQAQFSARRAHRESRSSQPFSDTASISALVPQGSLPSLLQVKPGGLLPLQMRVYEDFVEPSRVYPPNGDHGMYRDMDHDKTGYQQELDSHSIGHSPHPPSVSVTATIERFQTIISEVEQIIASAPAHSVTELPVDHELRRQIQTVVSLVNQQAMQDTTGTSLSVALSVAQKVVQLLYRSGSLLGREVYVLMLQQLCDLMAVVGQEVRDWLNYADDKRKLNVPVTMTLVTAGMIAPPELDQRLSQMLLKNPSDPTEIDFATEVVRRIIGGEVHQVTRKDISATLTCMLKLDENGSAPRPVVDLLAGLKRGPRRISTSDNGEIVVLDEKKQAQLKHFFLDWVRTYRSSSEPEKAFRSYVNYLHNEGILKGEDISAAFYKLAIQVAVDGDSGHSGQEASFIGSDSFAKLMVLVVTYQYSSDRTPDLNRASYYFKKVVNILSFCLVERHMELGEAFDQKPWTRIFTTLLSELDAYQYSHPPLYFNCLRILANAMGFTQPVYAPRFTFGWMSIITHRLFMPRLLAEDIDNSWAEYHKCLMWLLRFAEPFLKASEMNHSSRSLYRGICRTFCVLVHDFPDFLEEYYHSLVTSIPPHCIQLRNIVLSAFPSNDLALPDAHRGLERLKFEMQRVPVVRTDFSEALETGGIKAAIDAHVESGEPGIDKIVGELRSRVAVRSLSAEGPVITWNRTLLHAAVYYLGTTCIGRIAGRRGIINFDTKAPEVAILAHLAMSLDAEGQYYMICVIADQLRYPSAHTYFFASFMLWLFASAARAEQPNAIPERIGRVLLERIIVKRPHPFGLLVTFVDLLNDQRYRFWNQPFAQGDDEISNLFLKAHDQINSQRAESIELTSTAQSDHDY